MSLFSCFRKQPRTTLPTTDLSLDPFGDLQVDDSSNHQLADNDARVVKECLWHDEVLTIAEQQVTCDLMIHQTAVTSEQRKTLVDERYRSIMDMRHLTDQWSEVCYHREHDRLVDEILHQQEVIHAIERCTSKTVVEQAAEFVTHHPFLTGVLGSIAADRLNRR